MARWLLHRMRMWDVRTANGVDAYAANSRYVAQRIRKTYGRTASVIYPPVRVPAAFSPVRKQNYFFTASRLVPSKNLRQLSKHFASCHAITSSVAGDGPDHASWRPRLVQTFTLSALSTIMN